MRFSVSFLMFFLTFLNINGQSIIVEGYVFESDNRGYLNLVEIIISDADHGTSIETIYSDLEGKFKTELPAGKNYKIKAKKDLFYEKETVLTIDGKEPKVFIKMELSRQPGYIFDMTVAGKRSNLNTPVDAIMNANIEIYNNTSHKEEIAWLNHHEPHFKYTFQKGNHYTLLLRKEGLVAKRVEIYVNINGCILCVDGLGELRPGVTDNLTQGLQMGTLLANVEMDSVKINKTFTFRNIYYDYNKADIRPDAAKELKKAASFIKVNADLLLELGSHTDARGKDEYNMDLSERRARAAVDYLVKNLDVDHASLTAQGYGETKLVNHCANGVECTDEVHGVNRRTELKILGIQKEKPIWNSLAEMKREEEMEKMIVGLQTQEIYKVKDTAQSPSSGNPFTGFRIELMISEKELKKDHDLYKNYAPIFQEELSNGKYAYYTGSFLTVQNAKEWLEKMKIKSKYPRARFVQYKNGIKFG